MIDPATAAGDDMTPMSYSQPRQAKGRGLTGAVAPILDRGMNVYRRHFATFLVVSLIWSLPFLGLLLLSDGLLSSGLLGTVLFGWGWLIDLAAFPMLALLAVVLLLALVDALSRIAATADSGSPISWRLGLRPRPLRILGMAVFSLIYIVIASVLTVLCVCVSVTILSRGYDLLWEIGRGQPAADLLIFIVIAGALALYWLIIGSFGAGLCYALQPLIQNEGPMLRALGSGFRLLFSDLRGNMRLCVATALTAGGFGMAIASCLLTLTMLPFALFGLSTNDSFYTALFSALYFLSYLVALPPLLIWSALAYRRRNSAEILAGELEKRIAKLLAAPPAPPLN